MDLASVLIPVYKESDLLEQILKKLIMIIMNILKLDQLLAKFLKILIVVFCFQKDSVSDWIV